MQMLDQTIANVSLPTIAGNLGVSPNQGTWVITSFGVATAISLPLTGWLAQRIGQVRLLRWSSDRCSCWLRCCAARRTQPRDARRWRASCRVRSPGR